MSAIVADQEWSWVHRVNIKDYPTGGYVYVVRYDDGVVKIGVSKNPKVRLQALCRHRPERHTIQEKYVSVCVNDPYFVERSIKHALYRKCKPCYGTECFCVSFNKVVNCVKLIIPESVDI